MFTGIVSEIGHIAWREGSQGNARMGIACGFEPETIAIGASIACSGICLTVTGVAVTANATQFTVDLSSETLERTTARGWTAGTPINLERALRLGDELGGHLVTGHIDGLAHLIRHTPMGNSHRLEWETDTALARYIAAKGSVTLDGVSLTVNEAQDRRFAVQIIPHTWQVTTLGRRVAGDAVNLEIDLLARYVERLTQRN